MISIEVEREKSGAVRHLSVAGHAGQAPYGKDIVCAAASALSETLVMGLTRVIQSKIAYRLDDGVLDLAVTEDRSEPAQAVMDTICLGFKDLADTEPDFVRYREFAKP